jgi:hypothetical protein
MHRISVILHRSEKGALWHFAHFVSDFLLPIHDLLFQLRGCNFDEKGTKPVIVELRRRPNLMLGHFEAVANQVFPEMQIKYVERFSTVPVVVRRGDWQNSLQCVETFNHLLRRRLNLQVRDTGVLIVQRGIDRVNYPGGHKSLTSGADRRTIGLGFDKLIETVCAKRSDARVVCFEDLSFADQVQIAMGADTLIAQHGAAFVHAYWMKRGSHLIELQSDSRQLCPSFVPTIANDCGHQLDIVRYPCRRKNRRLLMNISRPSKIAELL